MQILINITIVLGAISVLLTLYGIFYYRNKSKQKEKSKIFYSEILTTDSIDIQTDGYNQTTSLTIFTINKELSHRSSKVLKPCFNQEPVYDDYNQWIGTNE